MKQFGTVRAIACGLAVLTAAGQMVAQTPTMTRSTALHPVLVENRGQYGKAVRYRTALPWPSATITDEGLVLTQLRREADGRLIGHNVRLRFVGARVASMQSIHGVEPAPTRCSYFLGNDPDKWVADVPGWNALRIEGIAPGVSVDVHGRGGVLEYDLVVAPGVTPEGVVVVVEGADSLHLRSDGGLDFATPAGVIHQAPPLAWEVDEAGRTVELESRVRLLGENRFDFEVVGRDANRSLRIDPGLGYSTFVEGSGSEQGYAIAVDAAGSAYVAGNSTSTDFPVTPGAFQPSKAPNEGNHDAVIAKLSPDGSSLLYATYLGGDGSDTPNAIQVDSHGNAYVGGYASAADFPTTPGAYSETMSGSSDAFVTILNPTGTALIASTYFGGSAPEPIKFDSCEDLALDALGRIVIGGATRSADLPVTPNAFQRSIPLPVASGGFIARLSADLSSVDYCSYVGCTEVRGVAVGGMQSLFAAGEVSTNGAQGLPITPGAFQTTFGGDRDAFVLKTNPDGSLAWCTLVGGNVADRPQALELDSAGHAVLAGFTESWNFPTTPGAFDPLPNGWEDGFIVKLAPDGSALDWGTFVGGGDVESQWGDLAIDTAGTCFITGQTFSANFPVSADAFDPTQNVADQADAFVAAISADGTQLHYGSYIGGTNASIDFAYDVAVDLLGNPFITGYTNSADFPTTPGALDSQLSGPHGLFVSKFQLSPWSLAGPGVPGWNDLTPRLLASGPLLPLTSGTLDLDQARPTSPCTFVVGLSELGLPFKGGTLVPFPNLLLGLTTNSQGEIHLTWTTWPPAVPAGTKLWFQGWTKDVDSETGFSASNGLMALVPGG